MKLKFLLGGIGLAAMAAASVSRAQDHGHLHVGAAGWNQGDKLNFTNFRDFAESSQYVKTLVNSGIEKYAGFYDGNITLDVLHSEQLGSPVAGSPAPGSFMVGEIVSVAGPVGGVFGFWETNSVVGVPTFAIPAGTTNAAVRFELSDKILGAGDPGADPFGHIHGRRFTLDKPGNYTIGFRAIDVSTNGAGGGPIHSPSDVIYVSFQADYNIKSIAWNAGAATISAGTPIGSQFTLQSKTNLTDAAWTDVGTQIGTDTYQDFLDDAAGTTQKFYRLKIEGVQN